MNEKRSLNPLWNFLEYTPRGHPNVFGIYSPSLNILNWKLYCCFGVRLQYHSFPFLNWTTTIRHGKSFLSFKIDDFFYDNSGETLIIYKTMVCVSGWPSGLRRQTQGCHTFPLRNGSGRSISFFDGACFPSIKEDLSPPQPIFKQKRESLAKKILKLIVRQKRESSKLTLLLIFSISVAWIYFANFVWRSFWLFKKIHPLDYLFQCPCLGFILLIFFGDHCYRSKLTFIIYFNCKEVQKLTFRAQALRQSASRIVGCVCGLYLERWSDSIVVNMVTWKTRIN